MSEDDDVCIPSARGVDGDVDVGYVCDRFFGWVGCMGCWRDW